MNEHQITILSIDSRENFFLLETACKDSCLPVKNIPMPNFKDASLFLDLTRDIPDILTVGSGNLLREGNNKLIEILSKERFRCIKTFILTEFLGEEKHLPMEEIAGVHFIAMPIGYEDVVDLIGEIYESTHANSSKSNTDAWQVV